MRLVLCLTLLLAGARVFAACPSPTTSSGFLNPSGRINNHTTLEADDCTLVSANYGNLRVNVNNTLTVNGTLTIDGDFTVNGTLILNGMLVVTGTLNVNGSFQNNGDAEVGDNLIVDWGGQVDLGPASSLDVGGDVSNGGFFSALLNIEPGGTVEGVFTVGGDFYNNEEGVMEVGDGGLLSIAGDYVADNNSSLAIQDGGTFMASNVNDPGNTITSPPDDPCDDGCCGAQCGILPVELFSFSGSFNERSITLQWTTASETNNAYFEVHKSTNGADFEAIAVVEGHGTSHEPIRYTFTDTGIHSAANYYRLKQVDYDGAFEYHTTIFVQAEFRSSSNSISIYPNPLSHGFLTINYNGEPQAAAVQVSLYNMDGETVFQTELDATQRSWRLENLMGTLKAGFYMMLLSDGNQVYTERLMVR